MSTTTPSPEPDSLPVAEVLCLGETMVLLASATSTPLENAAEVNLYVAGAESNVAIGLSHLGHRAEWYGRLGHDPFGARIRDFLADTGVVVSRVTVDETRPTGVYFKDQADGHSQVYYYRAGSAASALSAADLDRLSLDRRRLCHVSGITAALSPSCDDLLQQIIVERRSAAATISFDVNYRPTLWSVAAAGPRLLELARAADIVVVGRDEADALWSTGDAAGVRALLPEVPQLVVKDAHLGATQFDADGETFVPALAIEVVEPVGAGDAFAAGLLSGWLRGWKAAASLRLGHIMAGYTLQDVSDIPTLPERAAILALAQTPEAEWAGLRLTLPAVAAAADAIVSDEVAVSAAVGASTMTAGASTMKGTTIVN